MCLFTNKNKEIKNLNQEQKLVKALNRLEKKTVNPFLKQAVQSQLQILLEIMRSFLKHLKNINFKI